MQKLLVSSCLLGQPVRYNGTAVSAESESLSRWLEEGRIVPFCPELAAGFTVPRRPVELLQGDGLDVLEGRAIAKDSDGAEVTALYISGAKLALRTAQKHGVKVAILNDGSPSCGSSYIYDGSFSGQKSKRHGVTAALLRQNGIEVFSESEVELAAKRIADLEGNS